MKSRKIFFFLVLIFISTGLWAQTHLSTQAHQDAVNKIAITKDGSIFSAGKDGFLIRWSADGIGEHYQIT